MKRAWLPRCVAGLSAMACSFAVQAQAYPSKPLKLVVPFAAGTATDGLARLLGQHLSDALKQAVIVDNKPGANGVLGADAVAKAAPDGHTVLFTTNTTQAANPSLMKTLPYKPATDFAPVALVGQGSFVLATRPDAPFSTLAQLVSQAKAKPGTLSYATANSSGIVSGAMLSSGAGIDWVHVPYKSGPTAISDVLGKQVSALFVDLQSGLPNIQSGKLKAIALTAAKPNPLLPGVPSMASLPGLKGFDLGYWTAVYVPAATPAPVIEVLNREVVRFTQRKDVIDKYAALGFTIAGSTPAELGKFTASETLKWKKLIEAAGITPE